jgi:hypothetical protein
MHQWLPQALDAELCFQFQCCVVGALAQLQPFPLPALRLSSSKGTRRMASSDSGHSSDDSSGSDEPDRSSAVP